MSKDKLLNIDSNLLSSSPSQAPDDSDGSYKVGPVCPDGMHEYALRFSLPHGAEKWDNEHRFKLAKMFNKHFKVHSYIWSFELKDEKETSFNPHLHAYLIAPYISSSTKSDYIKKVLYPFIRPDALGRTMTNEQKELKKNKNYKAYIIKDGNYITNYTTEEMEEIIELKDEIQDSQKMRVEHKLLKIIKDKQAVLDEAYSKLTQDEKDYNTKSYEVFTDLNDLCDVIINIYIFDWDKSPPINKIKEYSLFVGRRMNNNICMRQKILFWN